MPSLKAINDLFATAVRRSPRVNGLVATKFTMSFGVVSLEKSTVRSSSIRVAGRRASQTSAESPMKRAIDFGMSARLRPHQPGKAEADIGRWHSFAKARTRLSSPILVIGV